MSEQVGSPGQNPVTPEAAVVDAPAPGNPPASARPAQGQVHRFGAGMLLGIAFAALAMIAWQWYDNRTQLFALKDELARRLAEGEARNKEALASAQEVRAGVAILQGKVETLENGLAESQNQQVALEALYQQLSRNSDEWALAEIEQTLTIAAQQLQLAGNVRAAMLALENADLRLARIDRPQLAPLRKVIERDIERLRVAPQVDVVGVAARLDALMDAVDILPLAMQQRPPLEAPAPAAEAAEPSMFVRLAREMWRDLRSMVRIQIVDRPEVPLVDPGQEFFLRENLKLRLLSARLALLQRDEKTYRADLQAARHWLERFYETRDRNLAATLRALGQLSEIDIGVDVPDISASLAAVRDYKLTRDRGTR